MKTPRRRAKPGAADATARETIGERLHRLGGRLTKSERRLARALFSSNMMAGFDTVLELARRAHVSGPTVLRFTAKLGYASYPQFQRGLRGDIEARLSSPLSMFGGRGSDRGDRLATAREAYKRGLDATLRAEQSVEFDAIARDLCAARHRIYVRGGRFTGLLAEMLWAHLYQLRPDVHLVPGSGMRAEAAALALTKRDVLVVLDVRRYQDDTIAFARHASDQGARIILITDTWLSPIAEFADLVLSCRVDSTTPFDSLVPCLALVETLVAAVTARLDTAGRARMTRLESVRARLAQPALAQASSRRRGQSSG